jgi:serine/threonine-protein kinase
VNAVGPGLNVRSRSLEPFGETNKTSLPEPTEIRAQVQKILKSRMFSHSERLIRFISFAAQHALNGTGEPLKEYVVGVEVFDRTPAYDPRIDPIVRVEARRLRSKLECYYASVGREDPVLVEFPKGTYVPIFRIRTSTQTMLRLVNDSTSRLAVAVLPFAPLTRKGLDNGFAAGLTEEVVHRLTNVRELRLMPWNAAVHGNTEKMDALLRGSVRCESRRVRVIAQFIDASRQAYLWSESYDRYSRNVLWTQGSIARAIVARVEVTLNGVRGTEVINHCYRDVSCGRSGGGAERQALRSASRARAGYEDLKIS